MKFCGGQGRIWGASRTQLPQCQALLITSSAGCSRADLITYCKKASLQQNLGEKESFAPCVKPGLIWLAHFSQDTPASLAADHTFLSCVLFCKSPHIRTLAGFYRILQVTLSFLENAFIHWGFCVKLCHFSYCYPKRGIRTEWCRVWGCNITNSRTFYLFFSPSPQVHIKLNILKNWQTRPRSKVMKLNSMFSNTCNSIGLQLLTQNNFYLTFRGLGLSQVKVQISYWTYSLFFLLYVWSNKEASNHSKSNSKWFRHFQTCCLIILNVEVHLNMISAVFWLAITDNLHN